MTSIALELDYYSIKKWIKYMRTNNLCSEDTIAMHDELFDGEILYKSQKEKGISVAALSRLTGLPRTAIYRAFKKQSRKPYCLLIKLALDHPEIFIIEKDGK